MTRVDIEEAMYFKAPDTKENLTVESVTLKHKGQKIIIDEWGTVLSYQKNFTQETESFQVNRPVIVFDIMYATSDDKKTNWEKFQEKYDKLFEGYTVVYIDSSKHNTMTNNQASNLPIYILQNMEKQDKLREIELELKKSLDSELLFDTENKTWYHDKYGFAIIGKDGEIFKIGKAKVSILKILEGFSYKEICDILRSVEDKAIQHSRL